MEAQPQMVGELCKVLQKKFRAANGSDQTKGLHYERYVIKLTKKLEKEFRNPFDNCRRVSASNCCHQVNIPGNNTIYLYVFNFVVQHDNNYDTAYDKRGKLGKETVVLNYASGSHSRSNKVRHVRSPFEKQTFVSDTESETETEESSNQQHYDYSTMTSFLRSNETLVSNDDDESSIETMYDEFSLSHISIPVSTKSGLFSSSRGSSFHTSRSSSSRRGDKNKNDDSSQINIKRPTTTNPFRNGSLADPPGERGGRTSTSRRTNDRDDDDRSFQTSITSDKSNKKKSHSWFF